MVWKQQAARRQNWGELTESIQNFPCSNWTHNITQVLLGNSWRDFSAPSIQMINSPALVAGGKSLCSPKDWPCEKLLASLPVSGEPSPLCQDHPVVLMWSNAGEKILCRNFSCTWNVQRSLKPGSFVKQSSCGTFRGWTGNTNLFFKDLRFPFLNGVSTYWINEVNGRLNNVLPEKTPNLLGKKYCDTLHL